MNEGFMIPDKVIELMEKGVRIPNPCCVEIGEDVDTGRISGSGVVLHSGTKLYGSDTLVCAGARLGYEAPVTLVDCQLGRGVELRGGFFKGSVFLDGVEVAYGAHVREGCILEEKVRAAHAVGLKQTILFPFVTLGSLINFCDCLMSGGTDTENHSEVGSSYVHFNYTPHQDKATASLIGDVPAGVMLNQPPIFLGGQGGLVGPVRIAYGTVIAAGTIYKKDCLEKEKLLTEEGGSAAERDFNRGLYPGLARKVRNNMWYISNLLALRQWYMHVRSSFFFNHEFGRELYEGAIKKLDMAIGERVNRFRTFSEKIRDVAEDGILKGAEVYDNRQRLETCFTKGSEDTIAVEKRNLFIGALDAVRKTGKDYVETIRSLDDNTVSAGTAWLQTVVDEIMREALDIVPSCKQ